MRFWGKDPPETSPVFFEISGGSVTGWDHLAVERNNQDAHFILANPELTVALVADGCGSRSHSEVGAEIGTRILAQIIHEQYMRVFKSTKVNSQSIQQSPVFWDRVRLDLAAEVRTLANRMGRSLTEVISEYFLFSLVGVLIDEFQATFFCLGDGYVVINGEIIEIEPLENNSPPYLAYEIIGSSLKDQSPDLLKFNLIKSIELDNLENFLIGTDGIKNLILNEDELISGLNQVVGPLSQFWQEDRYFKNPDTIRRRLTVINGGVPRVNNQTGDLTIHKGYLKDDTTMIVGRKGGIA